MKIPKHILITAKLLEIISPKSAALLAARLFSTPVKYKTPKREWQMEINSQKQKIRVPGIKKEIQVYIYGESTKKALLTHGWSGRGTQLVKIADELVKEGYQTISFDAPAHGKSKGKTTLMHEFIASIHQLEKEFGPFEIAIGHSLGGMSILNAIKQKLNIKKAVIIGSGDDIQDIVVEFVKKLKLKSDIAILLKDYFEKKYGEDMESYSGYIAAKKVAIPVLVIHDENDSEVPVKCAIHIHEHLINGELLLTQNLGHRKILGDEKVLQEIKKFLEK